MLNYRNCNFLNVGLGGGVYGGNIFVFVLCIV